MNNDQQKDLKCEQEDELNWEDWEDEENSDSGDDSDWNSGEEKAKVDELIKTRDSIVSEVNERIAEIDSDMDLLNRAKAESDEELKKVIDALKPKYQKLMNCINAHK